MIVLLLYCLPLFCVLLYIRNITDSQQSAAIASSIIGAARQHIVTARQIMSNFGGANCRERHVCVRPDYHDTAWGRMLHEQSINDPTSPAGKRFERRFGITYAMYYEVSEAAKLWTLTNEDEEIIWKADAGPTDCFGRPTVPLNIKILGVFRMLSKVSLR